MNKIFFNSLRNTCVPKKLRYFLFILLMVSFTNYSCAQPEVAQNDHPDIVHPRFIDFPVPSAGIEVRTNPPILRWPVMNEKNIKFDVRLSKNADFNPNDDYYEFTDLNWSMVNPHQKLDTGTWYWQYRIAGSAWKDTMSFNITKNAISLVSPPANVFLNALPTDHPRVLTTSNDLPKLRSLDNDVEISAIYKEAEKSLSFKVPSETEGISQKEGDDEKQNRKFQLDASKRLGSTVYDNSYVLCQAYILSGDKRYADKAIDIAMKVSEWDPRGVSSINDFGDARCMLTMALVFDTFHHLLNENQKSVLLNSIRPRADHFYNSWINNIEVKVLSGHVWQHILHYFFQTAVALYNEEPDASKWLEYAYELFLARTPVLGGLDGGWVEGISYFKMNIETVVDIPLTIKKYTGFDFINTHPWYIENIKWMVYHIPPGSASDGFGDNSEEIKSPGSAYIEYASILAKLTGSPLAAWYAVESAKYERQNNLSPKAFRWTRISTTNDLEMPDVSPGSLPMGAVFKDVGLAALHSDINDTPNNLMVAFKSSPFGSYGHMLCDQNTFNILYGGEKVFYRTGYKVTMDDPHRTGWYRTTKSQNGILINGEGQPYSNGSYGFIAQFLQGEKIGYIKGDATQAYQEENLSSAGVKKVWRHVLLLKPDIVIIYDELEAETEVNWSWLIHSLDPMNADPVNRSFIVEKPKVIGQGKFFSSMEVEWALTDTFDVPAYNWRGSRRSDGTLKTYDDAQYHLKITNREKSKSMRFLTILQISPSANVAKEFTQHKPVTNGNVELILNNWTIAANLNVTDVPTLEVKDQDGTSTFSLYPSEKKFQGSTNSNYFISKTLLIENIKGRETTLTSEDEIPYEMHQRILTNRK